ncbi:cell division protein ZapE [Oryzomicrobium terrae]|uniref:Cell division protein ZapE n=1 Tax=Oryzomicrobium terrae TaxID=1735038 RepID=A0A5C1E771_9RHOO|nr:cell division protein ZapE [Oryzomicrobium terrae]QEL64078.1 cell division protein ZapE [Oryzomicrobium terrae]
MTSTSAPCRLVQVPAVSADAAYTTDAAAATAATPPHPSAGHPSPDPWRDCLAAALAARGCIPDAAQQRALTRLALLAAAVAGCVESAPGAAGPRGLFLWGGVGRGKTLLVDLLAASLPPGTVLRRHQHAFLADLHRAIAAAREGGADDAFAQAVDDLLAGARLLVLDEFHAHDIADALILGRALAAIHAAGAALVFTANHPPAELWPDTAFHQAQADRYQPVADFIARHCDLLEVDGGQDYRLQGAAAAPRWWVGATAAEGDTALADWLGLPFGGRAGDAAGAASKGVANPGGEKLILAGRPIPVRARAGAGEGGLWFDFAALCGSPRSPGDYLALALQAPRLAISDVPRFGPRDGDALRRFIWLIDAAYEAGVALAATATSPWDELLDGAPDLARLLGRDLRRCASRLAEMTRRSPRVPDRAGSRGA